jgi:HYR domain-containing protein
MTRAGVIVVCLVMAMFTSAGTARAHYGPVLSGSGTATIDGVLAPGEWNGSASAPTTTLESYPGWPGDGQMRAMSDDTNLYVAVRIPFEPLTGFGVGGAISLGFDDDDDGVIDEAGDDFWSVNPAFQTDDSVLIACPPNPFACSVADTAVGGTNDVTAAIGHDGSFVVVEIRHPLVSGDANDIALLAGGRVGFQLSYTLFKADGSAQGRLLGDIEPARTDTTPPLVTVPTGLTSAATGPTGAVVSYTASATDDVDGPVPVSCSPSSGGTFPIGTTTVHCTATDSSGNNASASFTIHVKGATEQLSDLAAAVQELGPGTSLADKLNDARAALDKNKTARACSDLNDFIHQVQAQAGKTIPATTAAPLITDATRITAVIAC